ncbi:DUF4880 domain-containing protein [Pseudomonas sp. NPDC007930]|uniref:DUF4880 domain-containing protein n=1 Tax=Pseudomonas sp. NPDC007930 TaxID=3364417 RepID=UPI0036F0263C
MNGALRAASVARPVAEQAVHWWLELQGGPLADEQRRQWQAWLAASPEHARAWAHIDQVNQHLGGLAPPLAHATVGLPTAPARRRALKTLLVLAMAGGAGVLLERQGSFTPLLADYRSGLGERRRWALPDHSQLELNSGSCADAHFAGGERLVRLLEGEAFITCAAAAQPLRLATAQGALLLDQARADVRLLGGRTRVSLFSGRAQVLPKSWAGAPLWLEAGRQLEFTEAQALAPRPLDPNASAWRDGMLIAAHMPLAEFLGELGRYRRGHLQCDPAVARLLLSGSYPLGDTERILDLLPSALPVRVQRVTRFWARVVAA